MQEEVKEFEELKTKWPIQLIDERWEWGRVTINKGQHSERLEAGESVTLLNPVSNAFGGEEDTKLFIQVLEASGHGGEIVDDHLIITAGNNGLTIRQGIGKAFVLRGWDSNGNLLGRYSVGAVVLRGVARKIELDEPRNKKQRKDTKIKFAYWNSYEFYN